MSYLLAQFSMVLVQANVQYYYLEAQLPRVFRVEVVEGLGGWLGQLGGTRHRAEQNAGVGVGTLKKQGPQSDQGLIERTYLAGVDFTLAVERRS